MAPSLITPLAAGPDDVQQWRVLCQEHPEPRARLDRIVGSEQHAANLEAKHLREYHVASGFPELNLSAVCTLVLFAHEVDWRREERNDNEPGEVTEATVVLGMWEALTGLPRAEAVALAQRVQASAEPTTAHVAPF